MTFTMSETDALVGATCIECGQAFRVGEGVELGSHLLLPRACILLLGAATQKSLSASYPRLRETRRVSEPGQPHAGTASKALNPSTVRACPSHRTSKRERFRTVNYDRGATRPYSVFSCFLRRPDQHFRKAPSRRVPAYRPAF